MSTSVDSNASMTVAATAPLSEPAAPALPNPHGKRSQNNHNQNRNKRRRRGKPQPPPPEPKGCSVCKIVKENEPPKYKCPKCRATYCSVACCRKHKEICPGKQEAKCTPATTNGTSSATNTTTTTSTAQPQTPTKESTADAESSDTDYSSDGDESSLEDGWEITDEMKVALRNSTWLRTELQDGGLRDMIASVVKSERKYKSYHKKQRNNRNHRNRGPRNAQPNHPHEDLASNRQTNQNFDSFMDKLLVLADVLERQEETLDLETGQKLAAGASNRNEEELEEWLRCKWDPKLPRPALALRPRQKKAIPKFEPVDDVSSSSSSEDEDDDDDESS